MCGIELYYGGSKYESMGDTTTASVVSYDVPAGNWLYSVIIGMKDYDLDGTDNYIVYVYFSLGGDYVCSRKDEDCNGAND